MQDPENDNIVFYCKHCHSLYILVDETLAGEEWDGSYCGKCQSTDIATCSMEDWLAEEEKRRLKKLEMEWKK